jgi:hypothetical protein
MSPQARKYIYTITIAVMPILVTAGLLTDQLGSQILNAVAAVLAIGSSALAHRNVK